MSLTSSVNIANQALLVNQAAITVISNNIANADTEGYSKLNVNLASVITQIPKSNSTLSLANTLSGVQISEIQRASDWLLQNYYWGENSNYSYLDKSTVIASNIEDIMNELNDTGLSTALSNFYVATNALSNDPSDMTVRQNYLSAAENVCSVFNSLSGRLTDLSTSLVGDPTNPGTLPSSEISDNISQVNNLLDQIAGVNLSIVKTNATRTTSAALLDQRDQLLTELSSLIPIAVEEKSNNTVNISLGYTSLLQGSVVKGYLDVDSGTAANPAIVNIVDESGATIVADVNSDINAGKMGALLDICGSDPLKFTISGILDNLNTMANAFAGIVNTIQTGDPLADGTTAMAIDSATKTLIPATEDMFIDTDGSGTITAANIGINSNIISDPFLIAAARLDLSAYTLPSEYENAIGNNSNMTLILDSRTNSYAAFGNMTMEDYLSSTVSKVGNDIKTLNNSFYSQSAVLAQIDSKLKAEIAVSLDEEMVNLIKFQRAYQAAARLFTVASDLMAEVMNLAN